MTVFSMYSFLIAVEGAAIWLYKLYLLKVDLKIFHQLNLYVFEETIVLSLLS